MSKEQMHSVLHNLTEDKAPASQINLLSAVQFRIQMSPSIQSKGIIMKDQTNLKTRKLRPAFIITAIVLIGAIFFSLPEGRILAQEIMHFFTRGETNVMPGPTATPVKWVEQTPGVAAPTFTPQPTPVGLVFEPYCGSFTNPYCSIDEIRKMVAFKVFALPDLPYGMYFLGATGGPESILITYGIPGQAGYLDIREETYTGDPDQMDWVLGANADIESVQIGNATGEYVKGSYDGSKNPPVWNPDFDHQMLRWADHGVLFTLFMTGTNPPLDRDDLAALAANLTDGPVGESGEPVAVRPTSTSEPIDIHSVYPLSPSEAETLSGLKLLLPEKLPEVLSYIGAKYDEETKVVTILYRYVHPDMPELTDGVVINEQLAGENNDCDLCGFKQGNGLQVEDYPIGKLVSNDAVIEFLHLNNGITGQYVQGIGWVSRDDVTGWQWDSTEYRKRLRFQTNDLAVEVWADTFDLTKADLIAIANSLK
jgi:hypothetical protein